MKISPQAIKYQKKNIFGSSFTGILVYCSRIEILLIYGTLMKTEAKSQTSFREN